MSFICQKLLVMVVQKFGGTSVGSATAMLNVMQIVSNTAAEKLVVLSALSGVTDMLQSYAKASLEEEKRLEKHILGRHLKQILELGLENNVQLKFKITDVINQLALLKTVSKKALLVQGELMSIEIFAALLTKNNVNCTILPSEYYLHLDDNGQPEYEPNEDFREWIRENQIVIAPGFVCFDNEGSLSNLGRGGSDFSATCFGAVLAADRIEIWTDIDGLHQNDPRYVEGTYPLREMAFSDAEELSFFGAKILHPLCVQPARVCNIPIHLKNTLKPTDQGTVISQKENDSRFLAVAAKDGIQVIKIDSSNMFDTYGYLNSVFSVFNKYKISVDALATSEVSISMTIDNHTCIDKAMNELKLLGEIQLSESNSLICVVGNFKANQSGIMSKILKTISGIPISLISYGGNERNITFVVPSIHKEETLVQLQDLFIQQTIESHESTNAIYSV